VLKLTSDQELADGMIRSSDFAPSKTAKLIKINKIQSGGDY
jgi:hypothetical protein